MSENEKKENKNNTDESIDSFVKQNGINEEILKEVIRKNVGILKQNDVRDIQLDHDVVLNNAMNESVDNAYVEMFKKITEIRNSAERQGPSQFKAVDVKKKKEGLDPIMVVSSVKANSVFFSCKLSGALDANSMRELKSERNMTGFNSSELFLFKNIIID